MLVNNPISEITFTDQAIIDIINNSFNNSATTLVVAEPISVQAVDNTIVSNTADESVVLPVIQEPVVDTFLELSPIFDTSEILKKLQNIKKSDREWPSSIHTLTTPNDAIDLIVVGCGGTGSRLVNLIAQLMLSKKNIHLTLWDDDIVVHKNLFRQNFYEFEVGESKVLALKDRYESLYGITISYNQCKFDASKVSTSVNCKSLIIFDCTDNINARRSIEQMMTTGYRNLRSAVGEIAIISCGNQKDFGQVHFGYKYFQSRSTREFKLTELSYILNDVFSDQCTFLSPFLSYNKDFKDSEVSTSCANLDIAEEQSMAINSTIAQIAFNLFFEFISGQGIKHNIIWANLSNSYSGNQIDTLNKLYEYNAKTLFGKGIVFQIDEYVDILHELSIFNSMLNTLHDQITNTPSLRSKFMNKIKSLYYTPVISQTTSSSRYYISEADCVSVSERFSTDLIKIIDNFLSFNTIDSKVKLTEQWTKCKILISFISSLLQDGIGYYDDEFKNRQRIFHLVRINIENYFIRTFNELSLNEYNMSLVMG